MIKITNHATKRFRERCNISEKRSDTYVTNKLLSLYETAVEVRLKPKYRIDALLNHDLEEAKYYRNGEWVMIIVDESMVTVHTADANRWEYFKKYRKRKIK